MLTTVGILLALFLWGPQKLPELARSLALARKEFEKAANEVSSTVMTTTGLAPISEDNALIVAANSLGITTQGKTKEEIAREIGAAAKK